MVKQYIISQITSLARRFPSTSYIVQLPSTDADHGSPVIGEYHKVSPAFVAIVWLNAAVSSGLRPSPYITCQAAARDGGALTCPA